MPVFFLPLKFQCYYPIHELWMMLTPDSSNNNRRHGDDELGVCDILAKVNMIQQNTYCRLTCPWVGPQAKEPHCTKFINWDPSPWTWKEAYSRRSWTGGNTTSIWGDQAWVRLVLCIVPRMGSLGKNYQVKLDHSHQVKLADRTGLEPATDLCQHRRARLPCFTKRDTEAQVTWLTRKKFTDANA
jgi:hypothetical protein